MFAFFHSISLRFLLSAGAIAILGVLVSGFVVSSQVRDYAETAFDRELKDQSIALITALEFDDQGQADFSLLTPNPRFQPVFSGWYWQLYLNQQPLAKSRSLWDSQLTLDPASKDPEGKISLLVGPREQALRTIQVYSKVAQGELAILVAGDTSDVEALTQRIKRLFWWLAPSLLITFLALTFVQTRFGLRPLNRVTHELKSLRAGDIQTLNPCPSPELSLLVQEINALQDENRALVERAKRDVGNLAHAIKTPLAVLKNLSLTSTDRKAATSTSDASIRAKTQEQALQIQKQIDRHLSMARSSATSSRNGEKLDFEDMAQSLIRALGKIHAAKQIDYSCNFELHINLRGDRSDFMEIFGNLMDNASKWAKSRVCLSAGQTDDRVWIVVDDDGPGIPEKRRKEALERGKRLDERTAGTGLGLSIVSDMAKVYGGTFELGDSHFGGLCARLTFPSAA